MDAYGSVSLHGFIICLLVKNGIVYDRAASKNSILISILIFLLVLLNDEISGFFQPVGA